MSQIVRRDDGHGYIELRPKDTKARYKRRLFLTKETLGWIDTYHKSVESDWILPGEKGNHLQDGAAYTAVKELFDRAGLKDTEEYVYSPHSFRTFTQSYMRKCGLNEGIIDAIIGHKAALGAKSHYGDWDENEAEWLDKCGNVTWVSEIPDKILTYPKLEKKVKALETFNKKLLAAILGEQSAKITGKKLTLEQRMARAKALLEDKSGE
jgi:hypothetical protein